MTHGETAGPDLGSLLPCSDRRLARRAAAGSTRAFAAIFDRYHQDLFRYCLSILRDSEDAADALQSTMASALRSLPGERRAIALRPWLFRVAHNHAISILRARSPVDSKIVEVEELPDLASETRLEVRERLRRLLGDLEALTQRQKSALTMRELSGLSFDEIGVALAISPQSARQTVYEARIALREFEEGRSMECEQVCGLISARDGRALRSRRMRAHLRACASCREFREAIGRRRADLAALTPPLPVIAAAGLLHGALGAGAGAAGGLGGAGAGATAVVGKGVGASLAVKSTASIVAATAIGVGAADFAGIVDAPLIGADTKSPKAVAAPAANDAPARAAPTAGAAEVAGSQAGSPSDAAVGQHAAHSGGRRGSPPSHSNAGGRSDTPPAHSNAGGASADFSAGAAGAPAHSNAGGQGAPEHSNAGGGGGPINSNPGGTPPSHSNAGGRSPEHRPGPEPATK